MSKYANRVALRLKSVSLCPLLLGIVICTVITVILMYMKLILWVGNIQDTLETREKDHMIKITQIRSQRISSLLSKTENNLKYLKNLYEEINSKNILPTDNLTEPYSIDVYNYVSGYYEHEDPIIWISPNDKLHIHELPEYDSLKLFFIFLKTLGKKSHKQFGLILANGFEVRYPALNMDYIVSAKPCGKNLPFDSRCLIAYKNDTSYISENLSLYYQYNLSLMLRGNEFTISSYLPDSYFIQKETEEKELYINIITNYEGNRIYLDDEDSILENFDKNISILFKLRGLELSKGSDYDIIQDFKNTDDVISIEGYNSDYMGSHAEVKLDSKNCSYNLLLLTLVNKRAAFEDFRIAVDRIFNTLMIQVSIFFMFITIGIIITSYLSISITNKLEKPINIIEMYLLGNIEKVPHLSFNKEVNSITKCLLEIEIIEEMLNPRFILHPNYYQRIENLKKVQLLFQTNKNAKGLAITRNLIGNAYFDNEEYEQALDYYRDALSETEVIYNEVLAQEHAETKLSYSDRKELKMKTGKDSHGWDAEKAKVLAMITDRIQQICYTKTTILEKSQEAINKLRGEWKSVIDFHTRCLQYYISTSSNYISMLKVLIDIAYIYHKLQYFHSALELLDVIYEEISKINSEYVENNKNDKGITIDIDIARLKRLSIKVKDCDGRQFYYNVSGITFEKDIIMQTVMYRRALIYLDMEKYYEAVFNFTLAVELGTWYDPKIRRIAIEKIYNIYYKFKIISDEPLLKNLHEKAQLKKRAIVFCLCYDIPNEISINEAIVAFTSEEIQSQNDKFGALTSEVNLNYYMEVVERDYPGLDIENLISSVNYSISRSHINDIVLQALRKIPKNSTDNLLVIISKSLHNKLGPTQIQDLNEEIKDTKLALISIDDLIPEDFIDFITNNNGVLINLISNPKQAFEELRKSFFRVY